MKLNIYKASAGSGKTHILAGKYIVESFAQKSPARSGSTLYEAFRDTMAFARILAVTFTNKAAGEMKARILQEVDKLATNRDTDYMDEICRRYPQYTPEQVRSRAKNIRSAILHNYSDFNLRTIDSFVQRIVRAFCYDININSGFSTQTDQDMVLNDLVELLLKKSDTDADLKSQFLAMSEDNVAEGNNYDFREPMKRVARLIFQEEFQKMEKYYKDLDLKEEDRRFYFNERLREITEIVDDFESQADSIAERSEKCFAKTGKKGSNLNQKIGWLQGCLQKLKECKLSNYVYEMAGGEGWLKKKGQNKDDIPVIEQLREELTPLINEAIALVEGKSKDYITANIIKKDFHAFILLGDLAQLMPEYRKENRMMLMQDATTFLNALVSENDAPFIYERVGNKFDHVYIDEFQDTSEHQWSNFRPLIDNTLAQGYENMIVGDVKQAIYRFRGGDWELLNHQVQEDIDPEYININTLDTNWRSRKNIVEFNDAIFQKAVSVLQCHSDGNLDFNMLKSIYADSYQKLPKNKDRHGGKVNVVFFEQPAAKKGGKGKPVEESAEDGDNSSDTATFKDKALLRMATEIDTLLKSGIKAKKICILVRDGKEASLSVNYLMEYQNSNSGAAKYEVISSDSLYIANSLTVSIMVNAMKYINNPDDMIAKVDMMKSYCSISNMDISDDTIIKAAISDEESEKILPQGFSDIRRQYSDMPLYDLCEKLIACFGLQQYMGDHEYLRTLEDCVLNFTKTYSSDLNRFVRWWDESGYKTAIQPSDEQDAVTVMTIHKSKGLDFSIQFIPFCDWDMEEGKGIKGGYLWVKSPEGNAFSNLPPIPVKYQSGLENSYFADYYYEEKRNQYVDSLNLLYVGLTRAVDELHIYCPLPPKSKDSKISNVGNLIYYCIQENPADCNPDIVDLSSHYNSENCELLMDHSHDLSRGNNTDQHKGFRLSNFRNSPWESKLQVRTSSADFFIQNSPFLQDRINHGLFMHNIMARIEYMEDAPQVLQEMKFQGRITEAQRTELANMLNEAFAIPEVNRWFSHEWKEVITERALLTKEGDIRIPDRVVCSDTETIVIDFKFGKEHDEYRDQIMEYANLLRSMKNPSYPNVKAYLYYVEAKKIVEVK
ncbi:MAG: UvrD-helicase domain-containing protein [Bacteroidales bacterium]|nr:UvrD-helicase domain-containing protein [Bacteroidales bacterium]